MGNNAIQDILMNDRFQGDMQQIVGITNFLDKWSAWIITLVAFIIILVAILRNVIAGAYAAFPKFWDKVTDAKQAVQGKGSGKTSIAWKALAFFIPDLKSLSDFSDSNIAPKDYFIKAIPQMIAVVLIGVTLYNGYQRDFVALSAGVASEITERLFLNTNPRAIVDKISAVSGRPDFASANDKSAQGVLTYRISEKGYSAVISKYHDVTDKAQKDRIAGLIESQVSQFLATKSEFIGDGWKSSYDVTLSTVTDADFSMESANAENENYKQFLNYIPVSQLGLNTLLYPGETWYVRTHLAFQKVAEVQAAATGRQGDLVVQASNVNNSAGKVQAVVIPSGTYKHATGYEQSYTHATSSEGIVITFKSGSQPSSGSDVIRISPAITYTDGAGVSHSIMYIKINPVGGGKEVYSYRNPDIKSTIGGSFN